MEQGFLNQREIARNISIIENNTEKAGSILKNLGHEKGFVIGVTGPPGAGKSTLTDALIEAFLKEGETVSVICIDPSSPFSKGAILGDRIRMGRWYDNNNVFIRSLSSKGSLGGLHPKAIEISDYLNTISNITIIETVGVGQSEVEIARLADVVLVVLVPEAGDDVQMMKSGLMEIADIFIVNKADRPDADAFVKNIKTRIAVHSNKNNRVAPVVKTVAHKQTGIDKLKEEILKFKNLNSSTDKSLELLTEKAYYLIREKRMHDVRKEELMNELKNAFNQPGFNLYAFTDRY